MLRNLTALFCISTLLVQIFAPVFVILFFAVSPMQAFFGRHLVAGQETKVNSFICPMGIEWENGSEQYLSAVFGNSHQHQDHTPLANMDDHMSHMDHAAHMDHHAASEDVTDSKPEPCPIEQTLIFFSQNTLYNIALFHIVLLLVFLAIQSRGSKKLYFFTSRRDLFDLFPQCQAPPAYA